MPTYPARTTYVSGFYNNKVTAGVNDRVYTAEDMRMPYAAIFSDGVKPDANGTLGSDLQVKAISGMTIQVSVGMGMFGGGYFKNSAVYNIILDSAGAVQRYDCVIVRADKSVARDTTIYVKSLDHVPTVSDLTRTDDIKEYVLAYVTVPPLATSITQSAITDCRLNQNLCGVITGVYQQLDGAAVAAQWEAAFMEWFDSVKNAFVSGATLVRAYSATYTTITENEATIPINIAQYNKNTDVLTVMIEGRIFLENVDYTITDNTKISLVLPLPVAGTQVQFQVLKSVDGSSAESVVSEVAALRAEMNTANSKLEYHYYCNGATDNALISNLAETFLTGGADYRSARIVLHGTFGARQPFSGTGASADPYIWIKAGQGTLTNRKIFFDFSDCGAVNITCTAGTYNVVFYGMAVDLIGANVVATGGAYVYMFSTPTNIVAHADSCRFWITATNGGHIAKSGTFRDCRVSFTVTAGDAFPFAVYDAGLLRLIGGEYYAYAGAGNASAVVRVLAAQTNAVAITYGINCPTIARSGFVQSAAINVESNSAKCSFTDTITALTITATGQNIRGTIAISKPTMM